MGGPLEFDIRLPATESESKELIQNLEIEITQLKEEQKRREARLMEDMHEAEELQKKFNESASKHSAPPVHQGPYIPPNANPNVVKLMKTIKDIFNDNVDYEAADALLLQANMDAPVALRQYENLCLINIKLNYNGNAYEEKFSTLTKGEDLLERIFTKCNIPRTHEVFVYKRNYESEPLDSTTLRGKTLGELEMCGGMTLCILSS